MPSRTSQIAQIGKRQIELSNLQKVLYPDDHIIKAQLIEYYLKLAPTFLAHVKGRPLSLVRYPDGIGGEAGCLPAQGEGPLPGGVLGIEARPQLPADPVEIHGREATRSATGQSPVTPEC